jgi:hypothetical protein
MPNIERNMLRELRVVIILTTTFIKNVTTKKKINVMKFLNEKTIISQRALKGFVLSKNIAALYKTKINEIILNNVKDESVQNVKIIVF